MNDPWSAGAEVGEYRLLHRLGGGTQGVVWLAEHAATGVRRALKTVPGAVDAELALRFQREGETLARINHPNVVRVHAAGVHAGRPWLAMDLVEGGDLQRRLDERGPLAPEAAARLVRDVARGLASVHAQGVLHRDVKPGNVLFDDQGAPRLADFGLARVEGDRRLTATGELLGTPAYLAPELVTGAAATVLSDVFALGGVLHCALTGEPPFGRGPLPALLLRLTSQEPAPPSSLRPGVPPALDAICLRGLARDPARRYPSATALANALDAFLRGTAAPRSRAPLAGLLFAAGAGLAGLAVVLVPRASWPVASSGGGGEPAPVPSAQPAPAPVASASPPPPASRWLERVVRERAVEVPRPDVFTAAEASSKVDLAIQQAARGLISGPALEEALRVGAASGHPWAEFELAQLLLSDGASGRRRPGQSPPEVEALDLLWRSGRSPLDPRPLARLAGLLIEGRGAVPQDLAAAREVMRLVEETPEPWPADKRMRAGCTWLALGGPGDLARALRRLRPLDAPDAEEIGRRLTGEVIREAPAGRVARALIVLEGRATVPADVLDSLGSPIDVLRAALLRGDPAERRAAQAWVVHAAAVGHPPARALLAEAKLVRPDPGELDLRDLIALDRTRFVVRSIDPVVLLELAQEHMAAVGILRTSRSPVEQGNALERVRVVALQRHPSAEWDLSTHFWLRDLRACGAWAALAAVDPADPDPNSLAEARIRVARVLLSDPDGDAQDEALALQWAESGLARLESGPVDSAHQKDLREGRLWTAVARLAVGADRSACEALARRAFEGAEPHHVEALGGLLERAALVPRRAAAVAIVRAALRR